MSEGKRGAAADLVQAPFLDDLERAEAAWLAARDADPTAPAPSPALQRDYAELEDLLDNLPLAVDQDGWQEEVLRRASAPATPLRPPIRRRTAWWAAGGLLAAAAVAFLVLRPGSRPALGDLEIEIRRGDQVRGDDAQAAVGDHLVIRGRSLATGDLRVFRADGVLVGHCPEGPGCMVTADGGRSLEVALDQPVSYRLILVTGLTGNLPEGTRDEYLDAVRAANAHIKKESKIEVK
jgi:hypothetical protein